MSAVYDTATKQAQLIAEARAWLDTPFAAHACIRGAGVDCVHLWAAIYIATGAVERFNPPKYKLDGGQHSTRSIIVDYLEQCGRFEKLALDPRPSTFDSLLPGDLLCFEFTSVAWHVGGFIGGLNHTFIHCVEKLGVVESMLTERKWSRLLGAVYRPSTLNPQPSTRS